MREIKFRAWHKADKRMVEVYGFSSNKWFLRGKQFPMPNGAVEIMQYTSLKDKNGKDIYEGDIVESSVNVGVVEWDSEKAAFVVKWYESFTHPLRQHRGVVKIIGNIYENPELAVGK